jgi:DNA-binding response OmpR family regulator
MAHRPDPDGFLVLVVSAETTIRQTRTLLMEGAGYKVVAVESRHKAIRTVQQFEFDIAILDHTLDKHDRTRLIRFIRQAAPVTSILVLHKSGADCGADLCLDSREGPEKLVTSVNMLLARRQDQKSDAASV